MPTNPLDLEEIKGLMATDVLRCPLHPDEKRCCLLYNDPCAQLGFYKERLRQAEADVESLKNTAVRLAREKLALSKAEEAWRPTESSPHATTVLACRFDDAAGEWVHAVVLSPLTYPFTHWRHLPDPPALTQQEDE